MSFRLADQTDIPGLEGFLATHIQTSMFPLANLRDYGLGSTEPRGLRFWLRGSGTAISAAYGQTNEGVAMPQLPNATAADWAELRELGCGGSLIGALGDAGQVRAMLAAWDLTDRPVTLDVNEPGFALALADLTISAIPEGSILAPLDQAPRDLLISWRAAYHTETLGTPMAEARENAARDIDTYIRRGTHRVLLVHEAPAAMTGFNAIVGDTVQIGGVYTPPAARGRGLARRAVALHLDEARRTGKHRAVLFAASDAASRVYTAIGFQPAGQFAMVHFRKTGTVA